MTDSRQRFEAWFEANAKYIEPADWFQWMDAAWQAAECEAARKCVEWISAWALDSDRHENMLNSIKQEFPGAWE